MSGSTISERRARGLASGLSFLPIQAMSRAAGRLAAAPLPPWLLHPAIRAFGRGFGVDFDEAQQPVEAFGSFQEFFTRRLRPDARPIDTAADAFVAPCDGAWGATGTVEAGQLLQVKGRPYSLAQLLGREAEAERFEGGCFATLYLSPRDYHRFHAPCPVEVVSASYRPGRLWPVNGIGLHGVDGLFAENERICAFLRPPGESGPAPLCIVAVGATMVGSVKVEFDRLETNRPGARATDVDYARPVRFDRGEEWGRFEFGSTLVVVATAAFLDLAAREPGTPLRLGERIGSLRSGPASR